MRIPADVGLSELRDTHAAAAPLEEALMLAAKAGRFDVVSQLARELEARRLERARNVVALEGRQRKR
ncbi:MAG: hypothetical protein FWD73_02360 [Polyangiaceae bacterium]|nr:hypothetical protein [Polyangiaceae bacterium]